MTWPGCRPLTPCVEDEDEFRSMLGLKPAPESVRSAWATQGGTRAPVTLQRLKESEEYAESGGRKGDDENEEG